MTQNESLSIVLGIIGPASILTAGLTMAIGSIAPALGEGKAVSQALSSIAQQPDEANTITRTFECKRSPSKCHGNLKIVLWLF